MSQVDLDAEHSLTGDDQVIHEAKRRFKNCENWESTFRTRFLNDIRFANADSDNKYQWPDSLRSTRDSQQRPCLTVNKTRQHNLHIINDAKQNTPRVKVLAVGGDASFQSAQVMQGVIRHIEYISNSDAAIDTATEFQIEGGIGYWRVVTDYAKADSFDQEIFIRPINNPLNIYLDPDIQEKDGSDARFGFIFDDMSREEFNEAYPKFKDIGDQSALGDTDAWIDDNHVRVAEYFCAVPKKDRLYAITDPATGNLVTQRASKMTKEQREQIKGVIDDPSIKYRTIEENEIEWYLIVGSTIVDHTIWPGKYIPIIRVIGEETVIEGEMDRKGHTRALKDPQRMYNYAASSAAEFTALQNKTPWIAAAQSIEGLETYYATANLNNPSVLPYNHVDDDGNPMPPPQRQDPPMVAPAFLQMMQDSDKQMDMASGQYEATFGEKSNEKSGKAIDSRQRQGETATYHYIDNLAIGIRFTGKILLDLIPKIYDTKRIIRILAEDGTDSMVQIDPEQQQAHQQQMDQQRKVVQTIFNPNVGEYDCVADVAPGYATKRDEAFNALTQIITQEPSTLMLIGDIWAKNADFADSEIVEERLRNMVPPQALGQNGPPPELAQMQEQLQKSQQINGKLLQKISEDSIKMKGYAEKEDINAYKATTDRMAVEGELLNKLGISPRLRAELLHELSMQEHSGNLNLVQSGFEHDLNMDALANAPQPQGTGNASTST